MVMEVQENDIAFFRNHDDIMDLSSEIQKALDSKFEIFLKNIAASSRENFYNLYALYKFGFEFKDKIDLHDSVLTVFDENNQPYAKLNDWKPIFLNNNNNGVCIRLQDESRNDDL